MYICPTCNCSLNYVKGNPGVFWRCPSCDGRSATISLLRKTIPRTIVNALWQSARTQPFPRKRVCPSCNNRMAEVPADTGQENQHLDVCTVCQLVWFDYGEYAALPNIPRTPTWEESLPQETRERLAMLEVEAIREKATEKDFHEQGPDCWWQWIPGILGMPIEQDCSELQALPWLTWGLAAIIVAVSLAAFQQLPETIQQWGLIPADFGRYGGLTLLTSFFLHGGLFHLVGNVYFLLIFGDNVEDRLGKWRYLLLLMCATLVGDISHILGNADSSIPCIGASGGISGIVAFYALQFPRARLGFMMRLYVVFRWVSLPASAMFTLWILMQLFGTWAQLSGFSNVSALAHLGGAATGLAFWLAHRYFYKA